MAMVVCLVMMCVMLCEMDNQGIQLEVWPRTELFIEPMERQEIE